MRPAGLVLAFVLAGCGADQIEMRHVEGGLDPGDVPAFLGKLAETSEALDAHKVDDLAKRILALEAPADWSTRLAIRRDGRLVSVLELNVARTASGSYAVSILANREVADAAEAYLRP